MLQNARIVLVRTLRSGNIGSVARAMANFGLCDLVLVAPQCDPRDEHGRAMASNAQTLLAAAKIVDSIPAALAGCVRTYALTGKVGFYRDAIAQSPRQAAAAAHELLAGGAAVGFVFGPEDHGLKTSELLHVDGVVTIPADPTYPILNIAAAATVLGYELFAACGAAPAPALPAGQAQLASDERKRVMFERLFDSLDRIGFFFGQNPDHLRHALRHLLGRVDLTVNEADILIGMARQIRWYTDHHPRDEPPLS